MSFKNPSFGGLGFFFLGILENYVIIRNKGEGGGIQIPTHPLNINRLQLIALKMHLLTGYTLWLGFKQR